MAFFEPLPPPPPDDPEPAETIWAPPRWDRPSEGTLPAVVGVSQLFGRTENVALALDHLRVYPNGFQLAVSSISSPRLPPELQMGGFSSFSLLAVGAAEPPEQDDAKKSDAKKSDAKKSDAKKSDTKKSDAKKSDAEKPPPPEPPRRFPLRPGRMFDSGPRIGVRFANGQSAGDRLVSMFDVAKDDDGVPTQPVIVGGGGGGGGGHFRFEYWVFPLPAAGPLEVFAEWSVVGLAEMKVVLDGDAVRDAAQRATVIWS